MENKKDIGNLNNKDFGIELDPNKNLKLVSISFIAEHSVICPKTWIPI